MAKIGMMRMKIGDKQESMKQFVSRRGEETKIKNNPAVMIGTRKKVKKVIRGI